MAETRYYVSEIVEPNPGIGRVPSISLITDPNAGNSLAFQTVYRISAGLPWGLVVARGNRHSLAQGAGITPFPVLTFDQTLAGADATERAAFLSALEAHGIDLSPLTPLSTSVRMMVQYLGELVDAAEGIAPPTFAAATFIIET